MLLFADTWTSDLAQMIVPITTPFAKQRRVTLATSKTTRSTRKLDCLFRIFISQIKFVDIEIFKANNLKMLKIH